MVTMGAPRAERQEDLQEKQEVLSPGDPSGPLKCFFKRKKTGQLPFPESKWCLGPVHCLRAEMKVWGFVFSTLPSFSSLSLPLLRIGAVSRVFENIPVNGSIICHYVE